VLCVECDGREYHSGGDNICRDMDRDDWLKENKGIQTLRFRGARLNRDPFACAYEALDAIGASSSRYTPRRKFNKPADVPCDPENDDADRDID
jgi:hypothetical protein